MFSLFIKMDGESGEPGPTRTVLRRGFGRNNNIERSTRERVSIVETENVI